VRTRSVLSKPPRRHHHLPKHPSGRGHKFILGISLEVGIKRAVEKRPGNGDGDEVFWKVGGADVLVTWLSSRSGVFEGIFCSLFSLLCHSLI
jgi:hypothetical protein